jgi:hypothetical protein
MSEARSTSRGEVSLTTDPTALTTDALRREVASLKELIEVHLDSAQRQRIQLESRLSDVPKLILEAVTHLRELQEERFNSIQTQFRERDTRTEQISLANKLAIDAALQAAKEAVGEQNKSNLLANAKSEAAFTKQMDLLTDTMKTMGQGIADKMDDLKERIVAMENRNLGKENMKTDVGSLWGHAVQALILIVAILSIVAAFIIRHG